MDELHGASKNNDRAVFDLCEAAAMLGVGRTLAYELVRTGHWPTPVIRIGRLIRIPKRPLLDFLQTGSQPVDLSA